MMGSRNGSGGREQPVVTTTKFGNLGAGQLQMMRFNRAVLVEFFERLENQACGKQAAALCRAEGSQRDRAVPDE